MFNCSQKHIKASYMSSTLLKLGYSDAVTCNCLTFHHCQGFLGSYGVILHIAIPNILSKLSFVHVCALTITVI